MMPKRFVWPTLLALGAAFTLSGVAMAQNSAAGAKANAPAASAQRGRGRGPVEGPAHDPHDLNGVWNMRGFAGGGGFGNLKPSLTPLGEELFKKAKSSNNGEYTLETTNDPVITHCFPPGVPRIYLQPFPWQIVQTPKETILLYEYDHTVRHIFTDGRKHPDAADIQPTYMGDSIGHWEGNTFVVDTVGFNDKTWLDRGGYGHTDQLHVVERFQRVNLNDLELDIRMEDPKAMTAPWNVHLQFQLHPNWNIEEQNCADNQSFLGFEK
jgi:hypothetical protein